MVFAAYLIALTVDTPRLEYYLGRFSVRAPSGTWTAPISEVPKPAPKEVAFRRNDVYAVWDSRGLTVRRGTLTRTDRLQDFPVSGRFFGKEEIQRTVEKIGMGARHQKADSLSGALRIGPNAYFLVRWNDAYGKPWTEALVRVPLDSAKPTFEFIGRFGGLSLAYKPIDQRLFLLDTRLACVVRRDDRWGLATYDLKSDRFDFRPFGAVLLSFLTTGPGLGTFVELTPYGTTVAGRVDFRRNYRRTLMEARGSARFLDAASPPIVLVSSHGFLRAIDVDTGAEARLGEMHAIGRAGPYIVVWSPAENPTAATLYAPDRWTPITAWRQPE